MNRAGGIKNFALVLGAAVLALVNSCGTYEAKATKPELDRYEMTNLLTDLHTVESAF